jgi:hypothetical protein
MTPPLSPPLPPEPPPLPLVEVSMTIEPVTEIEPACPGDASVRSASTPSLVLSVAPFASRVDVDA